MVKEIIYNLSRMKRVYFSGEIDEGIWSVDRYEDGRFEGETDTDGELEKVAKQAAELVILCEDDISRIPVSRTRSPKHAEHCDDHYLIGLDVGDKDYEDFLRSFYRHYQEIKKQRKEYDQASKEGRYEHAKAMSRGLHRGVIQ